MIEAGVKLAETRRRLRECREHPRYRSQPGHDLQDGPILTSVTDRPFEIEFQMFAMRCDAMVRG